MDLRFLIVAMAVLLMPFRYAAANSEGIPPAYSAKYTVHADGFKVGEMTRSLHPNSDGTWVLESSVYTTGLVALFKKDKITERSVWRPESGGFQPLEYESHYKGRSKDVVEKLEFHWQRGQLDSLRNGETTTVPLEAGVLDKLMYQVALRRDLANGAKHIEYRVADRGKIDLYRFDVVGEERLVTSVGEYETLKVQKGTTTIWVAPALDYLPVQIVQKDHGHTLASYITNLDH